MNHGWPALKFPPLNLWSIYKPLQEWWQASDELKELFELEKDFPPEEKQ